jgi:hypothetical protein
MLLVGLLAFVAAPGEGRGQAGFDRPGGDYSSIPVRNGDPRVCAQRCERDNRCRAWSFSYPSTATREATCWLKSKVPPVREDSCCISGVRGAAVIEPASGALEYSIDRYGGDYRSLDVAADATGEACAKLCREDGKCRAFTYLRPGYGSSSARCFLKDRITKPRRKPCCISGVVR